MAVMIMMIAKESKKVDAGDERRDDAGRLFWCPQRPFCSTIEDTAMYAIQILFYLILPALLITASRNVGPIRTKK